MNAALLFRALYQRRSSSRFRGLLVVNKTSRPFRTTARVFPVRTGAAVARQMSFNRGLMTHPLKARMATAEFQCRLGLGAFVGPFGGFAGRPKQDASLGGSGESF